MRSYQHLSNWFLTLYNISPQKPLYILVLPHLVLDSAQLLHLHYCTSFK